MLLSAGTRGGSAWTCQVPHEAASNTHNQAGEGTAFRGKTGYEQAVQFSQSSMRIVEHVKDTSYVNASLYASLYENGVSSKWAARITLLSVETSSDGQFAAKLSISSLTRRYSTYTQQYQPAK